MKLRTTVPVALVALLGLSVVTTAATAVTWHVNPEGTGATPDLQSALDMAKNGDTVLLEPGTYTGPGNRQVRFRGKAVLVTSVSGAASTIIDCEGLGRGFIFNEGESTNSIVEGVTITNGSAVDGGAIYAFSSGFRLRDCIITGCTATNRGGAVYSNGGVAFLTGNMISGNQAFAGGGAWLREQAFVENNRFENNVAATLGGGVFYQDINGIPGSSLFLQNCEFRGNTAADGGGAYLRADDIDVTAGANLFSDNTASNSGGGLYVGTLSSTVSVTGSTFSGNSAAVGGGLFCGHPSTSGGRAFIILSSILTGNSANTGAGIALDTDVKSVTIRNCDIVANNGDALSWHSNLRGSIEKCIVAFNSGFAVRCTASASPILVSCSNFFSNSFDNAFTCATDGGQNISANPKFCTDTTVAPFSLAEDSPCATANSPCGQRIGAVPVACSEGAVSLVCPDPVDIALPNPPPTVTLSGFVIRNLTNIARAFIYGIETSGPATFPGGLTFISGSTPILQVNEAFEPPATVLEIPDVPGPVLQQIDYDIFAADDFTITESCVTTIDYIVPVPTLFQEVRADIRDGRVIVAWSLYSDDPLTRLTIARARGTGSFATIADLVPSTTTFVDRDVAPGLSYSYVVVAHLADGHIVQSQRVDVSIPRPTLVLFPGTPNPFNPTTTIRFTLDHDAMVSLRVFDVSGRSVRTLIRSRRPAGAYSVVWDGTGDNGEPVASGVYIFRLDSGKATRTVKGTLIK